MVFFSFTTTVYFDVLFSACSSRIFLLSLYKLQVSVQSRSSRLWPFYQMTVNSSFLHCSCGSTKAGFTQCDTWHRYVLERSAPAKLKETNHCHELMTVLELKTENVKLSCKYNNLLTINLTCYLYTFCHM